MPSGSARYGRSPYRHASITRHGLAVTFSGVGIGIATAGLLVTPFASLGGSRAAGSALPLSARSRSPLRCRYCRHHAKRLNRIPIRRSTAMPPSLAGSLTFTASRARRISCRIRSWLRWWRRRRRSPVMVRQRGCSLALSRRRRQFGGVLPQGAGGFHALSWRRAWLKPLAMLAPFVLQGAAGALALAVGLGRYVHGISSLGTALGRALRPANGNATIGPLTVPRRRGSNNRPARRDTCRACYRLISLGASHRRGCSRNRGSRVCAAAWNVSLKSQRP